MGKSHHRAGRHYDAERYKGLDQHGISNRSDAAKSGMLRGNSNEHSSGAVADTFNRDDAGICPDGRATNGLSQHDSGVRNIDAERIRVPRGAPPQVRRSFNVEDINPLLRDPDIFNFFAIHGVERLDATALLADERNVLLVCEGGAILFCWNGPGIYEITEIWRPEFRGEYAREALLQALCWMFSHTDCKTILSRVPCVSLVARNPLIIDTGIGILQVMDDRTFKVLKPRQ